MSSTLSPAPVCHSSNLSTPVSSPHRVHRYGSCTPSSSANVVPFPRSMVLDGCQKGQSQSPRLIGLYRSPSAQMDLCAPGPSTFKLMASPSASPAKEARARKQAREAAAAARLVRGTPSRLSRETGPAAWTRSRGSSNQHRHDSSGSDDIDDDMLDPPRDRYDLSPAAPLADPVADAARQARIDTASADASRTHQRLSQLSAGVASQTPGPSNAFGLERHFATYVSMTPPASFGSRTSDETPFAWSGQHSTLAPATELRPAPAGIPRSQAFGRLAPLSDVSTASDHASTSTVSLNDLGPQGLGISGADELDDWQQVASVPRAAAATPGRSSLALGRTRAKTCLDPSTGSAVASRRGRVPTFLRSCESAGLDQHDMDVDSDNDADGQPLPSPSPIGDASFGAQVAAGISIDTSVDDSPLLQPGLFGPAVAASASQRDASRHARSATSSAQRENASVLMTPDRRQEAGPSHGQRNRALSSVATSRPVPEFLTPRSTSSSALVGDKLAGAATLFSFASQPRPTTRSAQAEGLTPESSREAKHRSMAPMSTGKLFQSEIAASGTLDDRRTRTESREGDAQWQTAVLSTPSSARAVRTTTPGSFSFPDEAGLRGASTDTPSRIFDPTTGFGADDSGVAFDDEDRLGTPLKRGNGGLLANSLGFRRAAGGAARLTHSRKSLSADSLTSPSKAEVGAVATPPRREASFHGRMPESRPAISAFHPFGPKERSALVNETRWSDGSSAASTPDRASIHAMASRKPFTSPVRGAGHMPSTSAPTHADAGGAALQNYMTPQNFKNVKPLQAAFMSTGLVSKRNRTRENSEGGGTGGPDIFPAPPRPNFGSALGLREVVAAANAHAAANADRHSHAMPDTPVKKGTAGMIPFPVAGSAGGGASLRPPSQAARRAPSPLGMHSPAAESISSGCSADSPLMPEACDSPTFNLLALSPPTAYSGDNAHEGRGWPAFSTIPRARRAPMSLSLAMRSADADDDAEATPTELPASPSLQQRSANRLPPPTSLRKGRAHQRAAPLAHSLGRKNSKATFRHEEGIASASPLKSYPQHFDSPAKMSRGIDLASRPGHKRGQLSDVEHAARHRPPYTRNRNSLGLQRKNSLGLNEVSPGDESVPMTPTRSAAQMKWFEAAQVLTTPSPSSRRQAAQQLRAQRRTLNQTGGRRTSQLSESFAAPETPSAQDRSVGSVEDLTVPGTPSGTASASLHGIDIGAGSRLQTCFTIEAVIGQGEFSEVIKAEDKTTGTAYAVKRMKKAFSGPRDRLRKLEEVDILRHLSRDDGHPNIISLVDAWEEGGHLFVQTELCSLGTLAFFLDQYGHSVGALDEPRVWKILAELSSGLAHIHGNGILHLDLKPANVFITELGTLKIGDFGMATRWPPPNAATILDGAALEATDAASAPSKLGGQLDEPRRPNAARRWSLEREGDREYLAPEIMRSGQYGKAADIFSLGLILLEAAGNVELPDNGEPWQKLRNDDFSDLDLSSLSGTMLRMLSSLLASDPARRPTIEEVVEHPVMAAVRARMARGLLASELDQLPDFQLPHSESGLTPSASNSSICSAASNRTAGRSDAEPSASARSGPSDGDVHHYGGGGLRFAASSSSLSSASSSALGLSGIPASASSRTTASTCSSLSSQVALNVRGALIQEPEDDFVREVMEADPLEQPLLSRSHGSSTCVGESSVGGRGGDGGGSRLDAFAFGAAGASSSYPYGSSLSSNASSSVCMSPTPHCQGCSKRTPLAEIQPQVGGAGMALYGSSSDLSDDAVAGMDMDLDDGN